MAVPTGTITRLYGDASQDFVLSGSIAASIASAKNGTVVGDAGFTGPGGAANNGQGWSVLDGSDNFGILPNVPTSFTLGAANFAISRTDRVGYFGGLNIIPLVSGFGAPGSTAEFVGSSTIKGSLGAGVAWDGASMTNLQFAVIGVPVPASVWTGGAVLVAMGVVAGICKYHKAVI